MKVEDDVIRWLSLVKLPESNRRQSGNIAPGQVWTKPVWSRTFGRTRYFCGAAFSSEHFPSIMSVQSSSELQQPISCGSDLGLSGNNEAPRDSHSWTLSYSWWIKKTRVYFSSLTCSWSSGGGGGGGVASWLPCCCCCCHCCCCCRCWLLSRAAISAILRSICSSRSRMDILNWLSAGGKGVRG